MELIRNYVVQSNVQCLVAVLAVVLALAVVVGFAAASQSKSINCFFLYI